MKPIKHYTDRFVNWRYSILVIVLASYACMITLSFVQWGCVTGNDCDLWTSILDHVYGIKGFVIYVR
jgi:hypothetical protein